MRQNNFSVSLRKTDKINIDDNSHHLPPDNGPFSEFKVADYYCPDEWSKDGIFVRAEEGMPFWIDFRANPECAVLPAIQRLNPVTGEAVNLEAGLSKDPKQNYLRLPEQLWLDGFANEGKVYQFVVTKAGVGLAVNEYVLPKHMQDSHALGFAFYLPKNPKPIPTPTVYAPPSYYKKKKESFHDYPYTWVKTASSSTTDSMWQGLFSKSITKCSNTCKSVGNVLRGMTNEEQNDAYELMSLDSCLNDDDDGGPALGRACAAACLDDDYDPPAKFCSTQSVEKETKTSGGIVLRDRAEDRDRFDEPETIDILEQHKAYDKASIGMGGRIDQLIVTDENTIEYYQEKPAATLILYFALPEQFEAIMKKGKRQDSKKKDKFTFSGKVGGVQVPLAK